MYLLYSTNNIIHIGHALAQKSPKQLHVHALNKTFLRNQFNSIDNIHINF